MPSQQLVNTVKLLRIPFSFFLMPVFLLALSQMEYIDPHTALYSFLILHLLIYPSSNGYNSYVDRDETPIGGLEKPPLPTRQLLYVTIVLDVLAVTLSAVLVNISFSILTLLYILASRAYSSRAIRLKKYPVLGFLTVVVFQGGFTYLMSAVGISNQVPEIDKTVVYIMLACSFQIAGAYPLTQIYQHEADHRDGVITLSYQLGYIGTFIFTAVMFLGCNVLYFLYFDSKGILTQFYVLQAFFVPIVAYFIRWMLRVIRSTQSADYQNTSQMNVISSLCMNVCFLILLLYNLSK